MFDEHDYLLEIVEEFGQAAQGLGVAPEFENYELFDGQLKFLSWRYGNLPYSAIVEVPTEKLFEALKVGETVRPYRYRIFAELLRLDAAALEKEGRFLEALERQRRALAFYMRAVHVAKGDQLPELRTHIEALLEEAGGSSFTDNTRRVFEADWASRVAIVGQPPGVKPPDGTDASTPS